MNQKILSVLLSGLLLSAAAEAAPKKVWITLGDAAYTQLQKLAPKIIAKESRALLTGAGLTAAERVHLVEVDEQQLSGLSAAVHQELHRCGGYMFHASEEAGRQALQPPATLLAAIRPSYVIDNQAVVNALLPQMQDSNIAGTIVGLSAFTNRYYTTTAGSNASDWLKTRWQQISAGRSDITVVQFSHAGWPQKSVILTIKGTDNAAEVVVLGGHLDSINGQGTSESTRAPGADDDASGIASLSEALRVIVAGGYKPRRTIKLMGYAAEEVGLRGSQEIAKSFKAADVKVVGVMQLDMTNYKGSDKDIYLYTDYTDNGQNQFVAGLLAAYLPAVKIGYDKCGYACSDHASWSAQGYFASMPFESSFNQDNPFIHTANDTYANSGNQAQHALKFAKMALAYMVELGSDGPAGPVPADKTENFSGKLTLGQKQSYGPFKVAAGTSINAVLSGSGDADLYLRKGSAATTSSFDCKSDGPASNENCSVKLTASGDVWLLINAYAAANYTLQVTYRSQ